MVTFTLPYELRRLVWHHQKQRYPILFECAVSTLKDFGLNEKNLQGDLGMTTVLHTHTRCLDFHPHLHFVVPGGCIQKKRKQWKKLKGQYLFNEFALVIEISAYIRCYKPGLFNNLIKSRPWRDLSLFVRDFSQNLAPLASPHNHPKHIP
jgi:hypothetical protein